jgi:hypothetical protein
VSVFLLYLTGIQIILSSHDKWVPVTTARCVIMLRMEEGPPKWRVVAKILNKQSPTANKGLSSRFGVRIGAYKSSSLL